MNQAKELTPLMRQYWEIKTLHQDKVLFFRMGDFYEMFYDDALKAAPLLGIALTSRNKKSQDETPMCGFPHHAVAGPINKLLACGLKVAICDQIEDPKLAKGIVKRAVTRILTPGMVYDPDNLDATKANFLAAIDQKSLSLIDVSTGEAFYFLAETSQLQRLLQTLPVAEIVLGSSEDQDLLKALPRVPVSLHESALQEHSLLSVDAPISARRLLSYVFSLAGFDLQKTLKVFELRELQGKLQLPQTTLKHLEIFASYTGEVDGTLFSAIQRTKTSQGTRLLREWMQFPLTNKKAILDRQDKLAAWIANPQKLKSAREILSGVGDIERRLSKINSPQVSPRDLASLADSLKGMARVLERPDHKLIAMIENTLVEEPPQTTRLGYIIRKGLDSYLDELIVLSTESKSLLQAMEDRERAETGISSLKIRYNNVFGYYIEITNTHKDKAPARYKRKQTLANAERFYTDELLELEKKVLSAQSKREQLEFEIFERLRLAILAESHNLLRLSQEVAELDLISSLAWLAIEKNLSRPTFSDGELELMSSRHPVVEQTTGVRFVPNDIQLKRGGCLLLTGPNMAGKSTLMRQVALISILAQMGAYVPAASAKLPLFDQILTRIGASDQLTEGLSTFMVEMTETATMLSQATSKSLLIVDEIGRGTSTFDGMSLAQSILEYLVSDLSCLSFFATHYHELTALSERYPRIRNAHMQVKEKSGVIEFLHTLTEGPALKSYGIQVAKLAGIPDSITKRARELLAAKEVANSLATPPSPVQFQLPLQSFVEPEENPVIKKLREFPINQKTPLQALEQLAQWQKDLSSPENNSAI